MARLIFTLVLSVFAKGAVEACCHHPCPERVPTFGDDCTISLGFDKPPDTCEYNEHCQTCDGEEVCVNITFAMCENEDGGLGGKWAIAMRDIEPCPPCEKNPDKPCPFIYRPVCGSNGKTYPNECVAKADCEFEFTDGKCCEKGSGEPELCTLECNNPVCGSNGRTYCNECLAKADCQFKWTKGPCSCEKGQPKPCNEIYSPVCASNGKTYGNECLAEADCEFKWTKGVCCKDTARKCNPKKCKKRQMFAKSCQATCAAHCLKDKKNKRCPKDKKNKCPPKGKPLDCTNKKTKKSCPASCPACVLPHNCFTKEVWSEEKVKWCCDNMQLGCCHDSLSCRACLSAGCGFYGSCLPSCDMIADVACYEGDAEKQCAAYDASQRDSKLCDAAIPPASPRGAAPPEGSCEACTSTIKGDGTPCRWFANIGACMAEGGLVGPGQTVCPPPSSPP